MDPAIEEDYNEEEEEEDDEEYESNSEGAGFENLLDSSGDLKNYHSITSQELVTVMNKTVKDIQCIIGMKKPALVRDLLSEHKWDKALLLEKLYLKNSMEPEKKKICQQNSIVQDTDDGPQECQICFDDDCQPNMMVGLDCGHQYCKDCWTEFLRTKIVDEGLSQTISCPTMKCETVIDDDLVTGLIKDELVRSKYNRLIVNSFVQCNKRMKWCPAAGCYRVIEVTDEITEILQVECACGHRFCYKCGSDWHAPVTCYFMKKWSMVEHQENATMQWIDNHTRSCPHCEANIEKRGGCNHMQCAQCSKHFCWSCMNKVCTGSSCRTTQSETERKLRGADRKKSYFFYFEHYHNHRKSLQFESELRTTLEKKIHTIKKTGVGEVWSEMTFLQTAADVLCKCRQTLMHSYVFSYFLEESNQRAIFKHNLADLQDVTEELSDMLERKLDYKNIDKMRVPIYEKTDYCRARRKALLGHICEGYEEGWWNWWG